MKIIFTISLLLFCLMVMGQKDATSVEFMSPPKKFSPQTWFHWMNGNIDQQGITDDLEAIKKQGISGVQIFNVNCKIPEGSVGFMTTEWRNLVKHTIKESNRLGLEFSIQNCDGWSESGGPWITPELSMQKVVWSAIHIKGGKKVCINVPEPEKLLSYYKDISLIAYPSPKGSEYFNQLKPKLSSSIPTLNNSDSPLSEGWVVLTLPNPKKQISINLDYAIPYTVRALTITQNQKEGIEEGYLEVSNDGKKFTTICKLPLVTDGYSKLHQTTISFNAVTSRHYRILCKKSRGSKITVKIELHGDARINQFQAKSGDVARPVSNEFSNYELENETVIKKEKILFLNSYLNKDGQLNWDVPPGNWTILRIGHTSTGRVVSQSTPNGAGLELDKMSIKANELHFKEMISKLIDDSKQYVGSTFTNIHFDSWEALCQNWTPDFIEQFVRLRRYDPIPYLPVMTGRVVESLEISERFLWDVRRTIADLVAENHYGAMANLVRGKGLKMRAEALGPGNTNMTIADPFQCKAMVDIPMGEFWTGREISPDCKETSSSAHLWGKPIASAEAFTKVRGDWTDSPQSLKKYGDKAFCEGINQFVFHTYTHQPSWISKKPGLTMGQYGINLSRHNTWWNQSHIWIDYLSRCQYLLSKGEFIADYCYFVGEQCPSRLELKRNILPELPYGFDYDGFGTKELLELFSVKNGQIVTPSGMKYNMMVLNPDQRISLRVIRKIRDLVSSGAVIVGDKPHKSPSLEDYPMSDDSIRIISDQLWGKTGSRENLFGKGRVFCGVPVHEVLKKIGIKEDFKIKGDTSGISIDYIHRNDKGADIYFLSNQSLKAVDFIAEFRVLNKVPEYWYADDGQIKPVLVYEQKEGKTFIPMRLDPSGSVFVVFKNEYNQTPNFKSVLKDNIDVNPNEFLRFKNGKVELLTNQPGLFQLKRTSGEIINISNVDAPQPILLDHDYQLQFLDGLGTPEKIELENLISWSDHSNVNIKYYSGNALYTKSFNIDPKLDLYGHSFTLELGDVANIAEVTVNGKYLGILWKNPFNIDISDFIRNGDNLLEINVVNLWVNRLVGDEMFPELNKWNGPSLSNWPDWINQKVADPSKRYSFVTYKYFNNTDPLLKSGLLGPVRINIRKIIPLNLDNNASKEIPTK